MGAAGGVERFEDLHDLPVRLLQGPSVDSARLWSKTSSEAPEGPLVSDRHHRPTTPAEKGDQLSAERELTCPPTGILGCPRSQRSSSASERRFRWCMSRWWIARSSGRPVRGRAADRPSRGTPRTPGSDRSATG